MSLLLYIGSMVPQMTCAVYVNVSTLVGMPLSEEIVVRGHRPSEDHVAREKSGAYLEFPQLFDPTVISKSEIVPICKTKYIRPGPQCLASGETYRLYTSNEVIIFSVPEMATCEVDAVAMDDLCVNVTTAVGAVVNIYPMAQIIPNLPVYKGIAPEYEHRTPIITNEPSTLFCNLQPTVEYVVWSGYIKNTSESDEIYVACNKTFVSARSTQIAPVTRMHLRRTDSESASIFYEVDRVTDFIDGLNAMIYDEAFDETFVLWRPSSALAVVIGPAGKVIWSTFVRDGIRSNANYTVAFQLVSQGVELPYSESIPFTTKTGIQPAPKTPFIEEYNETHIHVVPDLTRVAAYGKSSYTLLGLYIFDGFVNIIENITCPDLCEPGFFVNETFLREREVTFAALRVVNENGISGLGGTVRLMARPVVMGDDEAIDMAIILSTILTTVCVSFIVAIFVVRKYCTKHYFTDILRPAYDSDYEVDRKCVTMLSQIGKGSSSIVYKGLLEKGGRRMDCAIKKIRADIDSSHINGFFREVSELKKLEHPNIVKMYATVTQSDPMFILFELHNRGSLIEMLKKMVSDERRFRKWAWHAYTAIEYIHSIGFVHRDIAARNFLVSDRDDLIMCDLGMVRTFEYAEEYRSKSMVHVAARWASVPSLVSGTFTQGTDTWSYSVLLYEIFSCGKLPYEEYPDVNEVFVAVVEHQVRLLPPPGTPECMANAMRNVFECNSVAELNMKECYGGCFNSPKHIETTL